MANQAMIQDQGKVPAISVIIPCYFEEPVPADSSFISCLDSINKQGIDVEVVLVDDASLSKNFIQVARRVLSCQPVVVSHEKNCGQGIARQSGYRVSKGDWITYLDQDDTLCEGWLREASTHFKDDIAVVHYSEVLVDEDGNTMKTTGPDFGSVHGLIFNKKFLKKYNINWSSEVRGGEDCYYAHLIELICSTLPASAYYKTCSIGYRWLMTTKSQTHQEFEGGLSYLEYYYEDFCKSFLLCIRDAMKLGVPRLQILPFALYWMSTLYYYEAVFPRNKELQKENQRFIEGLTTLLSLDRRDFFALLKVHPELLGQARASVEQSFYSFIQNKTVKDWLI